jgi:hypothetical protein
MFARRKVVEPVWELFTGSYSTQLSNAPGLVLHAAPRQYLDSQPFDVIDTNWLTDPLDQEVW